MKRRAVTSDSPSLVTPLSPRVGSDATTPRRRRRSSSLVVPVLGCAVLVFFMVAGPIIWGAEADRTNPMMINAGPSADHWLGTDQLGRDILARVLAAARLSLALALLATAMAASIGILLGIALSMSSPRVMNVGMRVVDGALAFPGLLFAIMMVAVFGAGATTAVVAVGIAGVPSYVRLACNLSSGVMSTDFVQNARVVGVGPVRLVRRYLLPNVIRSVGITTAYDVGLGLVVMSSLSFLGLGVQLPDYDWGRLLADGMKSVHVNVLAVVGPVVAIAFSGLVFASLGEVLSATGRTKRSASRAGRRVRGEVGPAPAADTVDEGPVVRVDDLRISFPAPDGSDIEVVRGVSVRVDPGEIVGIIGESGSGKTLTAFAISDLVDHAATVQARALTTVGVDLLRADARTRRRSLRHRVAVVFQEPMSSLNPTMTVSRQLTEVVRVFDRMSRRKARDLAVQRLSEVEIRDADRRVNQFPFELSGGMRQRVMIAMGLMKTPRLLVADEPTTALDVTVQAGLLRTLREVRVTHGVAVLLISHDLGVIKETCDRVYVMRRGEVVEAGRTSDVLADPQHPYTRRLLASVPGLDAVPRRRLTTPGDEG